MTKVANLPVVRGLGARALVDGEPVILEVFIANQTKDGDALLDSVWYAWQRNVTGVLVELAGGCTRFEGEGWWGGAHELTAVLRCHVSREKLMAGLPALRQVLVQYGRECEQAVVAFALDGEPFGLDPAAPY